MEFVNALILQLQEYHGVERRLTAPYHPQANGIAENRVKIAKNILFKFVSERPETWCEWLPTLQRAVNGHTMAIHGTSPFILMFNRVPNELTKFEGLPTLDPSKAEVERIIKLQRDIVEVLYPKTHETMKENLKKRDYQIAKRGRKKTEKKFAIGDKVYYRNFMKSKGTDPKWLGPCTIVRISRHGNLHLKDDETEKIRANALHPQDVRWYQSFKSQETLDQQAQWVIDHRLVGEGENKRKELKIQWKNGGPATWVAETDLVESEKIPRWRPKTGEAASDEQKIQSTATEFLSDTEAEDIGSTQLTQVEQPSRSEILEDTEEENDLEVEPSQEEKELQEQKEERTRTKVDQCQYGHCKGSKKPTKLWLTRVYDMDKSVWMCAVCSVDALGAYLAKTQSLDKRRPTIIQHSKGSIISQRGRVSKPKQVYQGSDSEIE